MPTSIQHAYYLAGYSIEFLLKACIAKNFRADCLPDKNYVQKIFQHDLSALVGLAGLNEDLAIKRKCPKFSGNWGAVQEWNVESRYQIHDVTKATDLYNAITDSESGVLPWIKMRYSTIK